MGDTLLIELMAGDWTPARVQWTNEGRAGLSLLRAFNFAVVTGQAPAPRGTVDYTG